MAYLIILDSGEYLCTVYSGDGGPARPVRSVRLAVSPLPAPPAQPKVQDLKVRMRAKWNF